MTGLLQFFFRQAGYLHDPLSIHAAFQQVAGDPYARFLLAFATSLP